VNNNWVSRERLGDPAQVGAMPEKRRMALWTAYVNAIGWSAGQLDTQEFAAFSKAAFYGIDRELAFNIVVGKIKGCGATNLRLQKIRHSLASAYASGGNGDRDTVRHLHRSAHKPYDELLLRSTVGDLAGKVDESYFIARSPVTTWNRTPAGFPHKLFRPGEKVWVTVDDRSINGCLWTHSGTAGCEAQWIELTARDDKSRPENFPAKFSCLDVFASGRQNVWFLANPIDGKAHQGERFECGWSYRCIEAVTDWRHLVLETDDAPSDLWLALLALLPLRIVAIYHSRGRGAHALVRINSPSKLTSDRIVELYRREYVPLGACKGTLSAFRLTRLPNCRRGETGQVQRLLYLNPEATGQPIKDQPVRREMLSA
jgi:hypothetical protein